MKFDLTQEMDGDLFQKLRQPVSYTTLVALQIVFDTKNIASQIWRT